MAEARDRGRRAHVTADASAGGRSRWARVKELFEQALDRPPEQRPVWIAMIAGSDIDLQREVEALLAAHAAADGFLDEGPLVDLDDLSAFPPGTRLGPYEIVTVLGRGGAGIVYLGRDERLNRLVALKLIASDASPDLRDRLRREARAAATIAHPSVATIYALEESEHELFIVSEYVRGRTLRAALGGGALHVDDVRRIAREIALALRAAHQAGVVHRDLKPENVLLADDGGVKVVDFGIARITGDATRITREGALLGTPAYMAPEQLLGTPADARADIYAFGIVLTEMLTGKHPGAERDPLNQPITGPAAALVEIARRCTHVDPGSRYQNVDALLDALGRAADGSTTARSNARWWWEFHQVTAAAVYALTAWPAWQARGVLGGDTGTGFFITVLAAIVVSAALRLHLWFTSRFYPAELHWVRERSSRWRAAADALFTVALVSAGILIRSRAASLTALLIAIAAGALVAAVRVEPATTRAAFGSSTPASV
jgi:predicted Ser/Thr protein kinase